MEGDVGGRPGRVGRRVARARLVCGARGERIERRGGLPSDLRWPLARWLGRRPEVLARRTGRDRGADHCRESHPRQHLSHLARRAASRFRAEAPVQADQPQLGRAIPQLGRARQLGQMGHRRLPGRHRPERPIHRHLLRRTLPRHPRRTGPENHHWRGPQAARGRVGRQPRRTAPSHRPGRLERLSHHRPRQPHYPENQWPGDVRAPCNFMPARP